MISHIPYINKACIDKLPLTILMVLQRIQSNAIMIVCIIYKRKDNALQACLCTLCDNGHDDDACEANHIYPTYLMYPNQRAYSDTHAPSVRSTNPSLN